MKNEIEINYNENGHDVIFTFRSPSEKEVLVNLQKSRKNMKAWAKRNSQEVEDYDLQKSRFYNFMSTLVKVKGLQNVDLARLLNPDYKGCSDGWDWTEPKKLSTPVPFSDKVKVMLCNSVGDKLATIQDSAIALLKKAKEDELLGELKN